VVAFLGHNFVHTFERIAFPILVIAFAIASVSVFSHAAPSTVPGHGGIGGFLLTVGAAFGYAAGWNPYASDYTRYLPPDTNRRATGWWAGFGVFLSCIVLETVGALAATAVSFDKYGGNPTEGFTSIMPTWVADFALVAIALGAVCANALNVYSGALSFLALGVKLPLALRRAIVAVVFGVAGFVLAIYGLKNAGVDYTNFLLIIAYWIGPWLGVFLTDQWLRRGRRVDGFMFDKRHNPWAGFAAMAIAAGLSVWLFSAQEDYHGYFAKKFPSIGDIAFEVGFVLAALLYWLFFNLQGGRDREEGLVVGAGSVPAPPAAVPAPAAPADDDVAVTTEGT
jgi:purine-cytosine permease-like protein